MKQKFISLLIMIFFLFFPLFLTGSNDETGISNPFGKAINQKAKRIYKNEKNYWEAEFDYGIIMIYIPAGEFSAGLGDKEKKWCLRHIGKTVFDKYHNTGKLHKVYLEDFWIGKNEVTFEQYDKYCEDTGQRKPGDRAWGRGKRPVIYVSWHEAVDYCEWLSKKTGLTFRLPADAEWEKAARGTEGLTFPWGNKFDKSKCNSNVTVMKSAHFFQKTTPVKKFPEGVSPYGCYDMAGNVSEWCSFWKKDNYKRPPGDLESPAGRYYRGIHGGSWKNDAIHCRAAYRSYVLPGIRTRSVGFRLTLDRPAKR